MKKAVLAGIALLLIMNLALPAYCDDPPKKLFRGICNLLTCPLEIPHRIADTYKHSGPFEAMTYGIWVGSCTMVLRGAVGFFEVISFPFPIPSGYEPVINDPEFLWKISD